MNYGELKQLVAQYLHRTDLTAQIPTFIELARQRINRDFRVRENITSGTLTPASNPFDVPEGFLEMRDIYYYRGAQRITLSLVGRKQLNSYALNSGAGPAVYSVDGTQIETAPGGEGVEFNLLYYDAVVDFPFDSSTNALLQTYPMSWLWASLIEGHNYTQDLELAAQAASYYTTEVQLANGRAAESESGASLQMAGASSWD